MLQQQTEARLGDDDAAPGVNGANWIHYRTQRIRLTCQTGKLDHPALLPGQVLTILGFKILPRVVVHILRGSATRGPELLDHCSICSVRHGPSSLKKCDIICVPNLYTLPQAAAGNPIGSRHIVRPPPPHFSTGFF